MGRWRPPTPRASPYITPAGFSALNKELEEIWVRRRTVVEALAAAAAEGDRSENAEYIYRKKELAGIDRRIRYLQKRLPELRVVRDQPASDAVYFGALVCIRDDAGSIHEYRIVGPDEAEMKSGAISVDSPAARALLGKRVDDEAHIATENSAKTVTIVSVRYGELE